MEEPFPRAMDLAMIFPLLWERTTKKINFLVWLMNLLHFLEEIKEMAVGGATSGIMYHVVVAFFGFGKLESISQKMKIYFKKC